MKELILEPEKEIDDEFSTVSSIWPCPVHRALTLGASQVKAEMYKGTFNLPVEAYWGSTVLSPGEHTVVIERAAMTPIVQLREGTQQIASVFTGPFVNEDRSQHGRLTLVQINGVYVVKTFDAGLIGKR